jgi:hypothetical protein
MLLARAGIRGVGHHTQVFSVEMLSPERFYSRWPRTAILSISAFLKGMSHSTQLILLIFITLVMMAS